MTSRTLNSRLAATLILFGCVSIGEAHAGATDGKGEDGKSAATQCPELFGTRKTRARNKLYRKRILHWAVEEPSGITVVHSHQGWEEVTRFKFPGVELLGRSETEDGVAVVKISEELADSVGCPAGSYRMRRDDALGRDSRVLAVFGSAVLIVHQGQLGYLAVPDLPPPRWLVAWKLPGATVYPQLRGGGGRRQRKRTAPKRKPTPRRRKR